MMDGRAQQAAVEKLASFPRLRLGMFPTPLEKMPRLRDALGPGCPRLFIKRDDLCGFGLGGNKVRKLEYTFAHLLSEGFTAVVTTGGERSNHARLTAAFCAKLGLKCYLIVDRKPRPRGTDELRPSAAYLEQLYGANVEVVDGIEERDATAEDKLAELRSAGVNAAAIPLGGATARSSLGFVLAMAELAAQSREIGVEFDCIAFASSTAATHAGMILGSKIFGLDGCELRGYSPEPDSRRSIAQAVSGILDECGEMLHIDTDDPRPLIKIDDDFAGDAYCAETEAAAEATSLTAHCEGILLDPVYTGKAMAGLFAAIRNGEIGSDKNILFWHTGGQFAQFFAPAHNC